MVPMLVGAPANCSACPCAKTALPWIYYFNAGYVNRERTSGSWKYYSFSQIILHQEQNWSCLTLQF